MIIGFSGKAGSGKTTAANYLVEHYGFVRMSFAKPLKEAAGLLFSLSLAQLYGDQKEVVDSRWGLSPRQILQRFGTDAMRTTFGEDIWTKIWFRSRPPNRHIVVDDVRFPDEADFIRFCLDNSGRNGRVFRLGYPHAPVISGHISETALDAYVFDAVVYADNKKQLFDCINTLVLPYYEDSQVSGYV